MLFVVNGYSMERWLMESDTYEYVIQNDPLFASLMENSQCREKFAATILDMAENEFLPERVDAFLTDFEAFMEAPLLKEHERFYGRDTKKQLDFKKELEELRVFFEGRYVYMKNYFGGDGERYEKKGN